MNTDLDRIRNALSFVPADDREIWVRMGMAIKSELGDSGFDLWDEWSQQADSYNPRDARDVLKSIRANGKVTAGTLFHEGKANGWRDDGTHRRLTLDELAERQAREEAEIAREREATAARALAIWKEATEARPDHPYLARKRVSPVATLREINADAAVAILGYPPKSGDESLTGRLLVVPIKQGDRISTLELIDGGGRKAAMAGRGSKAGGLWAAQPLPDGDVPTLLIGEGVATVLSAMEATRHPAVAALSAGNLPAVARAMRNRYPAATLVILADLVKATGEPDSHAIEAAEGVGGKVAIPDFGADRPEMATDFNDLAALRGLEAVREAIADAMTPEHLDGNNAPAGGKGGWQEPQPLSARVELEPYPLDALPKTIRAAVEEVAGFTKAPVPLVASSALAALSVAAQAHFDVKRADKLHGPSSLFLLTIADSGERKSTCDGFFSSAIRQYEPARRQETGTSGGNYC